MGYDADGNLTSDGVWNYVYDGENRLIQMNSTLLAGVGFTRLGIQFTYDYLGRRVEKKVTNLDTIKWFSITSSSTTAGPSSRRPTRRAT